MANRGFDDILGGLAVAAYVTDDQGCILYCNAAAKYLLGYEPEPGTRDSCSLWGIQSVVDQAIDKPEQPVAQAAGSAAGRQVVRLASDGTATPFLALAAPTGAAEGSVITLLIDLSPHLPSHDDAFRLAAIVESSDDAIVSKDLSGIIKSWNAGAERLFGYPAKEVIGKHIGLVIPNDRQGEEDLILSRVRQGQRVEHFDTVRKRKDGTFVPISLTVSPIRNSAGLIIGASKIARDITDRTANERHIHMLMREVNHRVKNQFAVILSMIHATARTSPDPAEFERQVRNRLMALSRSQDLLVNGSHDGVDLNILVRDHVEPFAGHGRVQVTGESVKLSANAVQHLGMAFHELATNSTKHGALSSKGGLVTIAWTLADRFRLTWLESGGPVSADASRAGFGRIVLERVAPAALNGVGHLSLRPAGAVWTLDAPVEQILDS